MRACSGILLLCGLLPMLASCGTHKPAAPLTEEQLKQQEQEKEKQQQEADALRLQYNEFLANLRQLQAGRSTMDQAFQLLGKPAAIAGEIWVYEVHPALTDPMQRFTLVFRNGKLASISSSGSFYVQPR